jgi:hypothetical protein
MLRVLGRGTIRADTSREGLEPSDEGSGGVAELTREAKAIDDLRADAEAAKVRTLELKHLSVDVQRRMTNDG